MPDREDLSGVVVPLLTPTDRDDRVDETGLRRSIDRLIAAGVHGLFVGGTAGEGPLLTEAEWDRLVAVAADAVGGRVPLLGGAQDTSTRRVLGKVRRLRAAGFRRFVVTPTYYVALKTPSEHLRLLAACHDAADGMELIPYNLPQVVGSQLAIDTLRAAAERGWFRCCKESSGDLNYLRQLVAVGRETGVTVLAGDERTAGDGLLAGAVGLVPVCANVEPATFVGLWEAARRGDAAEVRRLQARVQTLVDTIVLSGPCWLAGPKYALSRLGFGSGAPVSPLEPAAAAQTATIDAFLARG